MDITFLDLPDDVLGLVFSHLTLTEFVYVRRVCTLFRTIVETCITGIDFTPYKNLDALYQVRIRALVDAEDKKGANRFWSAAHCFIKVKFVWLSRSLVCAVSLLCCMPLTRSKV